MSQLDELQALAANNTAGEFALSGDTLAVLFYALDFVQNLNNWRDYSDEILDDTTVDEIRALVDNATDSLMRPIVIIPVGAIQMFPMEFAPEKWLICDGTAVSRTEYADLFGVIGTNYGVGDGTTTFNIPDWRDLSPMGYGGLLVGSAGAIQGAAEITLDTTQIPAHNHGLTDPGHNHAPLGASVFQTSNAGGSTAFEVDIAGQTRVQGATTANNTTGITAQNTGGGLPHNNLHPVMGVGFIIYTGVV